MIEQRECESEGRRLLANVRPGLSPRERMVLEKRLLAEVPAPLRKLAARLGVSGERTRQIEKQLLTRLRRLAMQGTPGALAPAA